MEKKVESYIKKHNLMEHGDKIIVALSGGPDSVCLLNVLYKLKEKLGMELIVCHVNHSLRGEESKRDEMFSKELSRSLGLTFREKTVDVEEMSKKESLSIESAARKARYTFFNELLEEYENSKIALAHNKNDQGETFLQRAIRGAGLKGLGGMEPKRDGKFIRPLLDITRKEIEEYIELNDLSYVIDSTNKTDDYGRNKIRHNLIPYIEENFNTSFIDTVARTQEIIRLEENYLDSLGRSALERLVIKDCNELILSKDLKKEHEVIKRRVLHLAMEKIKGDREDIYSYIIDDLMDLLEGQTGRTLDLVDRIKVRQSYGDLIFTKEDNNNQSNLSNSYNPIKELKYKESKSKELKSKEEITLDLLKEPQSVPFNKYIITIWKSDKDSKVKAKYKIDGDRLKKITIRTRKDGDRMTPLGMTGEKRLKSIFIDKKIDRNLREELPIITDEKGEIIYLHEGIISEKRKITQKTEEIMYINIEGLR